MIRKLFYTAVIFSLGCNSAGNKILKSQRKDWNHKSWLEDYKARALCKCLLYGYNDFPLSIKIREHDASFYNPIATAFFDSSINVLVKKEVIIIQLDSAANVGRVSEAAEGKTVFYHCYKFFKSQQLDSAMRAEKKKWKKVKNIEDELNRKNAL